jgi:hypothetical protein
MVNFTNIFRKFWWLFLLIILVVIGLVFLSKGGSGQASFGLFNTSVALPYQQYQQPTENMTPDQIAALEEFNKKVAEANKKLLYAKIAQARIDAWNTAERKFFNFLNSEIRRWRNEGSSTTAIADWLRDNWAMDREYGRLNVRPKWDAFWNEAFKASMGPEFQLAYRTSPSLVTEKLADREYNEPSARWGSENLSHYL